MIISVYIISNLQLAERGVGNFLSISCKHVLPRQPYIFEYHQNIYIFGEYASMQKNGKKRKKSSKTSFLIKEAHWQDIFSGQLLLKQASLLKFESNQLIQND